MFHSTLESRDNLSLGFARLNSSSAFSAQRPNFGQLAKATVNATVKAKPQRRSQHVCQAVANAPSSERRAHFKLRVTRILVSRPIFESVWLQFELCRSCAQIAASFAQTKNTKSSIKSNNLKTVHFSGAEMRTRFAFFPANASLIASLIASLHCARFVNFDP